MANSETSDKESTTSVIPPEMIPLLAEIEASTEAGKYITLTVPIETDEKSSTSTGIGKSPNKDNYRKLKLDSSTKSRQKRKKMEIYVRDSKKFIYVGNQIERWDQYRKELRVKNDEEFAKLLLDGFRKYTKVVQLVVGPTFGYPETVLGSDSSQSLHPLKKDDEDNMSDSDDLLDYIETVKDGADNLRDTDEGETGMDDGPDQDGENSTDQEQQG